MIECLYPEWPAPPSVRAAITTRAGGVSDAPWDSLNLADHVGDDPACVAENRHRLRAQLALPAEPFWLHQVHGCDVADADEAVTGTPCAADAAVATRPGSVCAVLTADCLPVLFCSRAGDWVAAAHAGWRGLAAGVLEHAVARAPLPAADLLAWLGPAIGPQAFEVGSEVRAAFLADDADAAACFAPSPAGRWLADLYALARRRLVRCGVGWVGGGGLCTFTDAARFFSFRRDGATGRMASLIWLAG
jgi:purine-nucleoside/S-methyl-5'-thioadenosine phosphorylase / adenosine deaminase